MTWLPGTIVNCAITGAAQDSCIPASMGLRSPRVLGNPKVPAPTSETPAGPPSQANTGEQARPPLARTAGAPATRPISGLNGPAQDTRCLRFVRWVAPPGRKTRFRLLAKLYRVGSKAHWVPPKGFFDDS